MTTHAFIDTQNMHMATSSQGWQVDFAKFRKYLKDKYGVDEAFMFMGYLPHMQALYTKMQRAGFTIIFKKVVQNSRTGQIKGNVDIQLTVYVMEHERDFDKAVLVTADGDFLPLVDYLKRNGKFRMVLSPAIRKETSHLLRTGAPDIAYLADMKSKIRR